MRIDYFKKYFVDFIDESNELGIPATIELYNEHSLCFPFEWVAVYDYKIVGNKMILLTDFYASDIAYEFTDKSIFDDITEVTFLVKDKEITDTKFMDASWSDRNFIFEGDFYEN